MNLHFSKIGYVMQQTVSVNETFDPIDLMSPPASCTFSMIEKVTANEAKEYVATIPSDKSIDKLCP